MTSMDEGRIERLSEENHRLKKRVLELEETLGTGRRKLEEETTRISRTVKLLQLKDQTLDQYAAELEKKREALEEMVEKLQKKNDQLQVWVSALRLYQDILENDPAAVIGLNPAGKVILFNQSAERMFAGGAKTLLGQALDALDFSRHNPRIPSLVNTVKQTFAPVDQEVENNGRKIHTLALPMGKGAKFYGVLLKISVSGGGETLNPKS